MFIEIQGKLEGLSSVFEEHTAISEEILSAVTIQKSNMGEIFGQIENVDAMSDRLKQMAN